MPTDQGPMSFKEAAQPVAQEMLIPLTRPEFCGNEWKYLKECLDSGWVSSAGPFVDRFEREVAAYVGSTHAVAMVNGTAALHLALRVAGIESDDEVLVSDFTFVAPVNAIRYCQAHPILVDANPETWQMDVPKLQRFLRSNCEVRSEICYNKRTGRRVRAILPVHLLGLSCAMDKILDLARTFHLKVVEDAAEGLGVRYQNRHVGTFADVGVLSFNGNKIVTAGGGGILLTQDRSLAEYARYLSTQAKNDPLEYLHNEIGYNYRLTNIQAALGLAQLERIKEFITKKKEITRTCSCALAEVEGVKPMPMPPFTQSNFWLYTFLLKEGTNVEKRKAFLHKLHSLGIGARPLWHPIHDLDPYRQCETLHLEHSTSLYERGISLPSSSSLTKEELETCVKGVLECLNR